MARADSANSRPSSFVEIIQQHLCGYFCDGNRPGEFDAPCEDEAQYERLLSQLIDVAVDIC